MLKYILLAIGVLAACASTAYFVAEAAAPTAAVDTTKGDLPIRGEKFTVIDDDEHAEAAADPGSLRPEPDGSVSMKFLFINKHPDGSTTQAAGRIAFKCHSQQWRIQSFYDLDASGKPTDAPKSADYEQIPSGSLLEDVAKFACHTPTPADSSL